MADLLTFEDNSVEPAKACKGLFYRAQIAMFKTDRGFAQSWRLNKLKRMSCRGCEKCGPLEDDLQEFLSMEEFPELPKGGLVNGSVYTLHGAGHMPSGWYDEVDYWLELRNHNDK